MNKTEQEKLLMLHSTGDYRIDIKNGPTDVELLRKGEMVFYTNKMMCCALPLCNISAYKVVVTKHVDWRNND